MAGEIERKLRRVPGDVGAALALLTRLPAPFADHERGARAAWAWPVAGLAVALIVGAVAAGGRWLGLADGVSAVLALAAGAVVTGGLHEDGLSDTLDGFGAGGSAERRLGVMKDSRIGAHGALALLLSVLLRWSCLVVALEAGLLWPAVLVAGVASRAAMTVVAWALPHARPDGLSRMTGRPTSDMALAAGLVALIVALLASPARVILVALVVAVAVVVLARGAKRRLGGQTGDVLGATQQVGEMAALIAMTIWP
ncbi:adenosylcobinamide-GDP ribazoletransferase [Pelagovum pacificum]|uniref:Adenosylcobinamide-GDP ribazoletransferase n=1 Tax=Pelagovum pacificum TaxID=2588711 RepID=A0A5C5GFK9_9RHOB|nr:adenosylcobinamide-GDP ribazoletransferase [Pelagovum pacificum]QQA44004.1 adenosylcobinamide-GDP ribazoletransferase [Pelagovum pacificum]TNY32867.1 adenosylcobinamide-GDP ribazoletransferase [Pelagovum pacificum]